jgi:hypothetical protein
LQHLKRVGLFLLTLVLIFSILPADLSARAATFDTLASPGDTDFNKDGVIDIKDLAELARMYGTRSTGSGWNPKFDLNSDGIIDIYDLVLCSKNIGMDLVQHTFNVYESLLPGKKTVVVKLINADPSKYDVFVKDVKLQYDLSLSAFAGDVLTAEAVESNLRIIEKTTAGIQYTFNVYESLLPGKKTVVVKLIDVDSKNYDVYVKNLKLDYDSFGNIFIGDVLSADSLEANLRIVSKITP